MKIYDEVGDEATFQVIARDWPSFRHLGGAGTSVLYVAGQVNASAMTAVALGTALHNVQYAYPFIAPARGGQVDLMQINVSTAGTSTADLRIGIYTNVATPRLYPNSLIFEGDALSLISTGVKSQTCQIDFNGGDLYWFTINNRANTPTAPQLRSVAVGGFNSILGWENVGTSIGTAGVLGFSTSLTYANTGAYMPSTFPAGAAKITSATLATVPAVAMRFSQ